MSEIFAALKIEQPVFLRLDGVNFSSLCDRIGLKKPFDKRLPEALAAASRSAFEKYNPRLAFIFSDELNFLFPPPFPFRGRLEKLNSILPSTVSGELSLILKVPTAFDCRTIIPGDAAGYLVERQGEAWRNHINAYAFHALLKEGTSPKQAASKLKGMKSAEIHEFMFRRDVNLAATPQWQRRGVMLYKRRYRKEGFNPKSGKKVEAERKRLIDDWELPIFHRPEGKSFLEGILEGL